MGKGGVMPESTMKEMDAAAMAAAAGKAEGEGPKSSQEKKATLDALSAALQHIEAQTLSGAAVLTPKEILLDLSDLQAKHPDKHFRWVNIRAPGVADRRRLDGYLRLPESDGGKELGGELAVFVTTKRLHEHRVAQHQKTTEERLQAHRAEVERIADGVARELRDKYGIKVDPSRLFVNEEG
jgi:hypothetical protein